MTLKQNLTELQQKARERTVKTQNIEYDLETLVKKVNRGVIKLDPEYQRRHRWPLDTSSRLIESLILNIPIPLIYLSQDVDVDAEINDDEARYSVIDGQQRLTAIVNFFGNKFALTGLDALKELEGSFYTDLPPFLIRRLEERTIKCLRIDSTLDQQVKYDIFERLNTGAIKLEPQELRNAVSRGPFNELIKELAQDDNFRVLLQIDDNDPEDNSKVKKMQDVELVLRFFALKNGNYTVRKGFKQFLTDEMDKMNTLSTDDLLEMKRLFQVTMRTIRSSFGDDAFARLGYNRGGEFVRLSSFNSAVYDALSIGVATNIDINNPKISPDAVDRFRSLFRDPKFSDTLSGAISDRDKVLKRIEAAKEATAQ